MKFLCDQKTSSIDQIEFRDGYDSIFIGSCVDLDDRSELVNKYILKGFSKKKIFYVFYDSQSFKMQVNGKIYTLDQAFNLISEVAGKSVLIECTTIDFVELTFILKQLYGKVDAIDFLYLSPDSYGKGFSPSINTHDFQLSDSFKKSMPVPGFTPMLGSHGSKVSLVAFVGFEGSRVGRVLNDDENATIKNLLIAFAVPPFQSGWENHSIFQHAQFLEESVCGEAEFISAYSPLSTYVFLADRIEPVIEDNDVLQIAAYGTKPSSIGASVYAVEKLLEQNEKMLAGDFSGILQISLQYDFPNKSSHRSSGVGNVYLYSLTS
ncbi:hypothetical protein [Thiomicrorhabdus xiamenensis]|uniref:Uncharacterized protein n=1 Tax=Thiomicrorhabdus xiamenensis TaxID=2739063 RepID=A0A7D4P062_9GAMM|nr:hypothetical protein [Thiomicrorhabdus xiamenensis]QKI90058.1 hypothetical protein HQN79_10960 [Thiomicrorhabdus xiamenensis]